MLRKSEAPAWRATVVLLQHSQDLNKDLNNATLPGGLLGRIPTHSNELGAWHDN
jgi:hypothetical protein